MEWLGYLKELDCKNLLDLVMDLDEKKKLLVAVVWKTIGKMIEHCQWMTAKKIGYFIRIKVVKMKVMQIKYQLLQMYMDCNNIVKYV